LNLNKSDLKSNVSSAMQMNPARNGGVFLLHVDILAGNFPFLVQAYGKEL